MHLKSSIHATEAHSYVRAKITAPAAAYANMSHSVASDICEHDICAFLSRSTQSSAECMYVLVNY